MAKVIVILVVSFSSCISVKYFLKDRQNQENMFVGYIGTNWQNWPKLYENTQRIMNKRTPYFGKLML